MNQIPANCDTCARNAETHRAGCSHVDCPHRPRTEWQPIVEGRQGYPGVLTEDRPQ